MSVNYFGIQERMQHAELTDEVFPHEYLFDSGMMYPWDKPRLSVDIDEEKVG